MASNRQVIYRITLILTGLLIFLSIYSTFLGADGAQNFFSSLPMRVFWFMFELLLLVGFIFFKRLRSKPAMFLAHFGVLLIIAGSMYGSEEGHRVFNSLREKNKIKSGLMVVYEGDSENVIIKDRTNTGVKLDFSIKLNQFYIDYYWPGEVLVKIPGGDVLRMPAVAGARAEVKGFGTFSVAATFDNFKLKITDDGRSVFDEEGSSDNPAVEVRYESSDGSSFSKYLFARFNESQEKGGFNFSYKLPVKEYTSEIEVIADGVKVKEFDIEVNKPLHYGGYYFYQSSYDTENLAYTVLSVSSDSGVWAALGGFAAMTAGVFWSCWIERDGRYKECKVKGGQADGN